MTFWMSTKLSNQLRYRTIFEPRVGFEPTMFVFLITSEVESTAVPPWLIVVSPGYVPAPPLYQSGALPNELTDNFVVLTGFEPMLTLWPLVCKTSALNQLSYRTIL